MITRAEKVRLGVFLIVSIVVVVATFITLTGIKLMESHDYYKVPFDESVSGLEMGAQVKYNGVRVGQVSDIRIDPKNVKHVVVTLEIRKGTPVKKDTSAVLVGMGITGLKFVELTGGTGSAELLKPGETIKAGRSFLGTLEGKAEDIAVKTELALNKINAVLNDKTLTNFEDLIENIKELSGNLNELIVDNKEKINIIIGDMSETTGDLKKSISSASRSIQEVENIIMMSHPKVDSIFDDATEVASSFKQTAKDLAKVDNILKKMKRTLEQFNKQIKAANIEGLSGSIQSTFKEADATVKSVRRIVDSSRENIYQSTRLLRKTLDNFEDFSSELKDHPSLLLRSEPPRRRTPPDK